MASEVENVSAEVVPRSGSESEPVMQHEHVPLLAACDQARLCSALKEATVPVLSGWTPAYLRWWQEQVRSQQTPGFFAVMLIGDASSPGLFSSLGLDHLTLSRYVKVTQLQ